ncbi:MAG: 3-hydroxyacyl-CoA dehydrogenase NAD-binding domain-containing protein, partial [bacterium]
VYGLGAMGHGIAIVTALAGYEVVGVEVDDDLLDKGLSKIKTYFERQVNKGRMEEKDRVSTLERLKGTKKPEELSDRDIVIEAITENIDMKCEVWRKLGKICKPETIFATNTSSLSVTQQAAESGRGDKFLGLHFFNPVPMMKLVEVVKAVQTSDETYKAGFEFAESLGKKAVKTDDKPGFIVNRLLVPYLNDAARVYEQGLASAEDIDAAMKYGANHPMGPLELIDLIGLDVAMWVGEILFREFGEARMGPPPIIRRKVRAGHLGRKTGKGFYDYGQ